MKAQHTIITSIFSQESRVREREKIELFNVCFYIFFVFFLRAICDNLNSFITVLYHLILHTMIIFGLTQKRVSDAFFLCSHYLVIPQCFSCDQITHIMNCMRCFSWLHISRIWKQLKLGDEFQTVMNGDELRHERMSWKFKSLMSWYCWRFLGNDDF